MANPDRAFPKLRPIASARSCGQCEHDLTGIPRTEPCPQCGWKSDIRCAACGYDITGLPVNGPCPECATPIAESLRGDGLAFASTKHLAMLDKGLAFTRLGVGLLIAIAICSIVLNIAVSMLTSSMPPRWVADIIVAGPVMACFALWIAGWWMVTTPDPRLADQEPDWQNAVARWSAVVFAMAFVAMLVGSQFIGHVRLAGVGLMAVLLVQYGAGSMCLRRIALSAGNGRAAAQARQVGVLVAIIAACLAIRGVQSAINFQPPRGSAGSVARLLLGLINLTFLFLAIVVMVRQANAAGLLRDDLKRFLFHAKSRG